MTLLDDNQIKHIISLIESGESIPLEYRSLLFPQSSPTLITENGQANVLIVDDNQTNRELLRDLLEYQGYESEDARTGIEALEILRANPIRFDLILLDVMMPQMTGFEVLEHLRDDEQLKHIPVIVISALTEINNSIKCIQLGAEDYMTKPFHPTLLKTRIGAILEKKHLRDQERALLIQLQEEQERSERLLLNILPAPIAKRLKQDESTIADYFAEATVLFADIVNFTTLSTGVPPEKLVSRLNTVFTEFDSLVEQHGLEKIKTIGDSYMVVGGIPEPNEDHASAAAKVALDMQEAISHHTIGEDEPLELRIGINTGPVVAGVIGSKKFIYDLWGDTVNIASRMEQQGMPGTIQVTQTTYDLLSDEFSFEERGAIEVKGMGEMNTYFLLSSLNN